MKAYDINFSFFRTVFLPVKFLISSAQSKAHYMYIDSKGTNFRGFAIFLAKVFKRNGFANFENMFISIVQKNQKIG